MFIPDPNKEMTDWDLAQADAQVVAWEADDEELKDIFRSGADLHLENAKAIYGNPRLTKDSPERQFAKVGVHAADYGVSARTLAVALGITVREADRFLTRWFSAHPGITEWHRRVEGFLQTTRSVSNKFGFVRYYFDRIEGVLPEALAWIPQSTVALVISHGLVRLNAELQKEVQILLQVHDSLVEQHLILDRDYLMPKIKKLLTVTVPYDDPLIIPISGKSSEKSWGDCK